MVHASTIMSNQNGEHFPPCARQAPAGEEMLPIRAIGMYSASCLMQAHAVRPRPNGPGAARSVHSDRTSSPNGSHTRMNRLADMTPSPRNRALFLLFLLLIGLAFDGRATETTEPPPAAATTVPQDTATAEAGGQPAGEENRAEAGEEYQHLRHRYRQDPTGVRARLGMCRGGGHCGQHRHRHGGSPWANP